jgi:predicted RNase H-like HicB family nuclease
VKTYIFRVVVEPDEDRWVSYCPTLDKYAADTWGYTREEALENIKEVIQMVLEEMAEDNEPIPEEFQATVVNSPEHLVTISV